MKKHVATCLVLLVSFAASFARAQAVAPTRVRVSQGVMQGLLLKKVNPEYPQDAKNDHVQGIVELKVIIDRQGSVAHIEVAGGPERLAAPAIEAVKQWKYRPYLLNGAPIEVETKVTVNFTLAD